jgi:formamidopyrimidine-DNA glycosylase
MPELPEVETVVRYLQPLVTGRVICSATAPDPLLHPFDPSRVRNVRIAGVERIGKQVVLVLERMRSSRSRWLAVHLRMTGRLSVIPRQDPLPEKHLRAWFDLGDVWLAFVDPRRFGTLQLVNTPDVLQPLGIDPLSPGFTSRQLAGLLQQSSQELKIWLLRQDRLVGLGNIYASESLFAAGLHPQRLTGSMAPAESQALYRAVRHVLRRAIRFCGTTFSDFQYGQSQRGSFQDKLAVYGRDGLPCRRCGAQIERIVQQQRSTFYCPDCQRD